MKRIPITIRTKSNPNFIALGYALSDDLTGDAIAFFTAHKFPLESTLTIQYSVHDDQHSLEVTLNSIHEQISSGRVFRSVPNEGEPLPNQVFYRCFSRLVQTESVAAAA